MSSSTMQMPSGPPYPPTAAGLGGLPNNNLDTPVTAVFLVLFITGAVAHMTIFQLNRKRGHKFIMSALMFGFCMSRILTCTLRIVWASKPKDINVAIAANVFVAAGVVLLIIINVIFAQRILRAEHPNKGWHPFVHFFFMGMYILIVLSLVLLVTLTVYSFFTLDPYLRNLARDFQIYGQSYFLYMSFFPIPATLITLLVPKTKRVEKFGTGRFRTKIAILLTAAALLTLNAGFKLGVNASPPRAQTDPAWYHSKACFYIFNFTIEIIVLYLYALVRVDRRFHVPNGSKGPGDYSQAAVEKEVDSADGSRSTGVRIMTEEETFDEIPSPEQKETSHV